VGEHFGKGWGKSMVEIAPFDALLDTVCLALMFRRIEIGERFETGEHGGKASGLLIEATAIGMTEVMFAGSAATHGGVAAIGKGATPVGR
jgi:hypothetical protein